MTARYTVSDDQIAVALIERAGSVTAWNLSRELHVGLHRLTRIADELNVRLAEKRTPPMAGAIKWDEHAYASKLCPRCVRWLGVEHFYESSSSANGYESWCRHCRLAATNERNAKKRRTPTDG